MKNRNRPALKKKRAQELHEAAGVPLGPCTFQEVQIFEDHLNIQIVVFSADNLNQVTYKGKERPLRINLWHHDNHYDVIKSVKGFFGSNYYCENCEKPYSQLRITSLSKGMLHMSSYVMSTWPTTKMQGLRQTLCI
ncbi:hypothetical protein CEXT_623211 [Caerostris extrusa]|uniref:Ubiquitinyl hydrolase 1 n=1 Tax=Caerostris extrusa TaxID=172846 RepID=A0AAV4PNJ3_CAEEX|nr:hypothetical protein CEXT_623211 [Caerostris extrusa]